MQKNSPDSAFRIALFVPSLNGGGAERVMLNLANAFSERGLVVDLVLLKAEGSYLQELSPQVRLVELGASRMMTGFLRLAHYLWKSKPQIMLSAMTHSNIIAILAAMLSTSQVPIIISEHSTVSVALNLNRGLKNTVIGWLMKVLYRYANGIVAVSNGVAIDLANLLGLDIGRITVIHNPIISEELLSRFGQPVAHPWLLNKSIPVVLSAGRLTLAKDFETLVKAFHVARKHCPMRLMILGEGELRLKIEALVVRLGLTDDVALPGFIDNPLDYMKRADLFVLSSQYEGFGNVLVEAMACGVPVISTNCPSGPAEILENGRWGRLVPVGDHDALAQAMLDTMKKQGPSSLERAMTFSIDRAVENYLQLLGAV